MSKTTPEQMKLRPKQFALRILRLCQALPKSDDARTISRQLLRSGTSVGANCRTVCRAKSDRDCLAKLGMVIEEADEIAFW